MGHLTMEWDSSLLRYWGVKIYADFFNGLSPQQRENAILHKPLHIIPECAIGYKKLAKEMAGSPMILGVWSIRKKVSVKFWTSPFWKKSIFQIYLMKI